ncbi:hypothetical protein KSS87_009211 [Heliosperma pusillum]|nr:hypothetical protein KSS87_009211 [Heliosperma pusillum]
MAGAMQFWGLEVKAKEPCKVSLDDGYIIHVSQATLGDIKKDNEPVIIHVKAGDKKLVMGILSQKTPQLSFDLVFDTDFEISHNWKNGTIHLMGYQSELGESYPFYHTSCRLDSLFLLSNASLAYCCRSSDDDEEPIPILRENGRPAALAAKAGNMLKQDEGDSDDDDSSEDGDDEDSEDSADEQGVDDDDSEDEEDDDDSEDSADDTPVKIDASKKRPNADAKTPQPKKAKIATPQKTDGKKGSSVHPATPHPAKKGGKTPGGDKTPKSGDKTPKSGDKTPKSGGSEVSCGSCKKTFKSDVALQSHSKAKHGAK